MPKNKVNNNIKLKSGGGILNDADGLQVDVGTTDGKIVQMTTGDKLPAVDGSNLTGIKSNSSVSSELGLTYFTTQINPGSSSKGVANNGGQINLNDSSDSAFFLGYLPGGSNGYLTFDSGKRIILKCFIQLFNGTSGSNFSFGIDNALLKASGGTGAYAQIRFYFDATNLMARVGKGTGAGDITTENITGITLTDLNEYIIDWDGADEAKFYINGVLKSTIITNLPKTIINHMNIIVAIAPTKSMSCSPIIASREL